MRNTILLALAFVCLLCSTPWAADARYEPNWESLDKRPMPEWFEQARFGIFIVWGPYAVPAWKDRGYAEWYGNNMRRKNSPTAKFHARVYGEDFKYEQFGPMLTAEMWDPDFWSDLFVRAGAKYVVTTANYHDGYCLWPSPYRKGWNAMDVGPKRDVLGELFEAGRKRDLVMGIYYSLYEWYHPLWLTDRDRFVTEHMHPQFKDVVTRYKPWIIFADGEWEMDYRKWRSEELLAWLFNESPVRDVVAVNDRWGKVRGKHGSFYESEYGGGKGWPDHPWQEDRGMGRSYGYNRNETIDDYDSRESLLRMMSKCVGNGGNYLLCVGPTADGRIPVIMQERLVQIGAWLKVNGEAIYGAKGSPLRPRNLKWGTCTTKPGRIFVHLYGRSADEVKLPGLKNRVKTAYLLAAEGKTPVSVRREETGLVLQLPPFLPDPAVSVIVVEIEGEPDVDTTIRQRRDGSVVLRTVEAQIHGARIRKGAGLMLHRELDEALGLTQQAKATRAQGRSVAGDQRKAATRRRMRGRCGPVRTEATHNG